MLVLRRRVGETIAFPVGEATIKVTILGIERGVVKLGFDAPPGVKIIREELLDGTRQPRPGGRDLFAEQGKETG